MYLLTMKNNIVTKMTDFIGHVPRKKKRVKKVHNFCKFSESCQFRWAEALGVCHSIFIEAFCFLPNAFVLIVSRVGRSGHMHKPVVQQRLQKLILAKSL
ncbi:hypothetical protein WN51_12511 [Melipona quadrifasciata]|uniref:Uncharacterized protein n=1 Tax=Melipona quadrifasciata TaxID=166423 RepID=A0A0N0U5U9_9HYME|nr:hypothetical protein WN51_12511 [Melipona quadrifasciata]